MRPEGEIQKADPATRARLLSWFVPLAVLGLLLAAGLTALTERLVAIAPLQLVYGLLALLILIGIAMLWPLRAMWLAGRAVIAARRFPPPGEPVLRDTRVRRGQEAVLRGRILQAFAVALAFFVLATPFAIGWLLNLVIA